VSSVEQQFGQAGFESVPHTPPSRVRIQTGPLAEAGPSSGRRELSVESVFDVREVSVH